MSKAVDSFNEWLEGRRVPTKVWNALSKEAEAIDHDAYMRYYWEFRKDIRSELSFAQAMCSIICEHEYATQEFNDPQIPN